MIGCLSCTRLICSQSGSLLRAKFAGLQFVTVVGQRHAVYTSRAV